MKSITKILGIGLLVCCSAHTASAQISALGESDGTIIAPITITKMVDMNFGNIAINSSAGTVELRADNTQARTSSGGVTLPSNTGTVQAAQFLISGEPTYTYAITLPGTHTVTKAGGGATMTLTSFAAGTTTSPTPATTGMLDALGFEDLWVGATLSVSGSQAPGVYSSTGGVGFDVTVNYN